MTAETREELYLAYLTGEAVSIPEPVTRKEQYFYDLCMKHGSDSLTTAQVLKLIADAPLQMDKDGVVS